MAVDIVVVTVTLCIYVCKVHGFFFSCCWMSLWNLCKVIHWELLFILFYSGTLLFFIFYFLLIWVYLSVGLLMLFIIPFFFSLFIIVKLCASAAVSWKSGKWTHLILCFLRNISAFYTKHTQIEGIKLHSKWHHI